MGQSYPVRGVSPPRGWTPKQGDVVYLQGKRTTLGKPDGDMFPLRPPVDGTTDMAACNLRQAVRIEAEPKHLSQEQLTALSNYALKYGRNWKSSLRDAWMSGDYCGFEQSNYLQQVRNSFGPSWLVRFSLSPIFDYDWQVWLIDGIVQGCMHPAEMSLYGHCCNQHRYKGQHISELRSPKGWDSV